jgi:opacity protein-like surface antigen
MRHLFASFGALVLGLLFATTTTQAQSRNFITRDSGLYWSFDAGASIPQDGHVTEFGPWNTGQRVSYDAGFGFDLGLGYLCNKFVATELQLGGTWNSIDSIEGASLHDTSLGTLPIMANLILQYPIPRTRVVPYIGGGAGGAATFFDTDEFYAPTPGGPIWLHGSDDDFVFAWQALAGVRVELNSRMSVGLGYRFLHMDPSSYTFESWHHGGPDLELGFSSFESHQVSLTFRMKF